MIRQGLQELGMSRIVLGGSLALLVLLALAHGATYVYAISDDAYISLRYADHLAGGEGLVYNAEQAPVEGFSNPIFTVASALLLALGIPPLWVLRVLGMVSVAATVLLLPRLVIRILPNANGLVLLAAPALFAASSLPTFAAMTGLETALHACLVLLATIVSVGEVRRFRVGAGPLAWLAVAASRPEGALLALVVAAAQADALELDRRVFVRWTLGFAAPGAVILLCRFLYFGALLPNTYYAKVAFSANALGSGLGYLQRFALGAGAWVVIPALIGYAVAIRRTEVRYVAIPLAVIVAQASYAVSVGGDFMPGHRFLMPVYPLLCAGAALVLAVPLLDEGSALRRTIAVLIFAGLCVGAGWHQHEALRASPLRFWLIHEEPWWSYFGYGDLEGTWLSAHQKTGEFLRENSRPGDLLVVTEAGVIPFHAGLETLDLFGLNDREVARTWQRFRRGDLRDVADFERTLQRNTFAAKPRWIVLDGHVDDRGFHPRTLPAQIVVRSPEFQQYETVFRATVYSGAEAGRSRDRINMVFRRSDPAAE